MDERVKEKKSTIADSLDKEVDCQDKNMEKKLSKKRKKPARDDNTNGGDHSILTEEEQSKKTKTEKMLSKKNKRSEYEVYETIEELATHNEGEDDDGRKKKKKKNKHKEYNEFEDDDQVRKMMKKKPTEESKPKEDSDFRSSEDADQVKKMKKKKKKNKKLTEESKPKEDSDFRSNEDEDAGQVKKMKKKNKKLTEESKPKGDSDFRSNEDEDADQVKMMKKKNKKLTEESKPKEDSDFRSNEDADQVKKMKKKNKKLTEESKPKEDSNFRSNEEGDLGKKKKKSKSKENRVLNSNEGEDGEQGENMKKKKKTKAATGDDSSNPGQEGTSKRKRVTFSNQVEVCCDGLVRGKRFTPEEDEKIKAAVFDYIVSHGLGDDGLDMILHCSKHPEVRGCWKEIANALPHRPHTYVYTRAHIMFERVKSKWTPEELEFIRKAQEQHGSDWKSIAEALGKGRNQVKDAWRNVKFTNINKGHWSQEEYQNLFNLVNLDLRVRASEGFRKSKHGMFRDNISWEAVGTKLSTRSSSWCCKKWYMQLASPMVKSGEWGDTDDYRMINALYILDACSMEEVDWDNLVEDRSGDVCRKRWGQMVQHIGQHVGKSFAEQVEVLAKRFCPELLEAREAFDNKPVIC